MDTECPHGPAFMRKSTRELVGKHRRERRLEDFTTERAIVNENKDSDTATVLSISRKLKSGVTVEELRQLKNAILSHPHNIEASLSCEGVLRGLARDISGHDVQKQLEAVGCCCNLALGDERAGLAVAKAAGPYIIEHTTSMSEQLAVASLWALGNLASSGIRPCLALSRQGVLHHLCNLLATTRNDEVLEAALYAVLHVVLQLKDQLSAEYHEKLLSVLVACGRPGTWRPLSVLSCHENYVVSARAHDVISAILRTIHTYKQIDNDDSKLLRFVLRCLANLCVEPDICDTVIDGCLENNFKMCYTLHELGKSLACNEMLWLLGNVIRYATERDEKGRFFDIVCCDSLV